MNRDDLLDICGLEEHGPILSRTEDGCLYRRQGGGWEHFDFNKEYQGYYTPCAFTKIAHIDGIFYLAGIDDEGCPHLFCSLLGGVWEPRNIIESNPLYGNTFAVGRIIQILYAKTLRQVFLISDGGQLIVLPDCPKCVRILEIDPGAVDGRLTDSELLVCYTDGHEQSIPLETATQFRVSMSYMRQQLNYGGILVDVRNKELCDTNPVPNSTNVPLEELHDWLRGQDKSRQIYFVCHVGVKADMAVKYARDNGFIRAYSVGGLNVAAHVD